jgi:predicted nucleic acid-binding protein
VADPSRGLTFRVARRSFSKVVLAKLGCFDLFHALFPQVFIPEEVHREVVISGAGLPGASEVAKAEWIEVRQLQNQLDLIAAQESYALGIGAGGASLE